MSRRPSSSRKREHVGAPSSDRRVVLRFPTPDDHAEYISLRSRSGTFLTRWEPRTPDGLIPSNETIFTRLMETSDTDTSKRVLVCIEPRTAESARPTTRTNSRDRAASSRPIAAADTNHPRDGFTSRGNDINSEVVGQISFNQISRGPFQNAILGYWIAKPFTGLGYMTRAMRLALRMAYSPAAELLEADSPLLGLGLHRVEANIIPRNAASLALVRSLGFRFEGLARRYLQIAGRWQDHERWAMTIEDWRRLTPPRHRRAQS